MITIIKLISSCLIKINWSAFTIIVIITSTCVETFNSLLMPKSIIMMVLTYLALNHKSIVITFTCMIGFPFCSSCTTQWCFHLSENIPVCLVTRHVDTDLSGEQDGVHELLLHFSQPPHPLQPNSTWGVEVDTPQRERRELLERLHKVPPRQTHTWGINKIALTGSDMKQRTERTPGD